jgi:3'-phosphoadenosine 5'-phosphosulfate sulfotransferase
MPRPHKPKYTTEQIVDALRQTHGLISKAAERLNCSTSTIYERKLGSKAIQQAIDECRDEIIDYAELALRSAVLERQPWAVALVLRTIGRKRGYYESHEVTIPQAIVLSWDDGKRPDATAKDKDSLLPAPGATGVP